MLIQVMIKEVYGKPTIYPICDKALIFASMVGQRTLTHRDIKFITSLGYKIEVVTNPKQLKVG